MSKTSVDERLLSKLEDVSRRFEEIEGQMHDPAIVSVPAKAIALAKERGRLEPLVGPYRTYLRFSDELTEAQGLAKDAAEDPDMRSLAAQEVAELTTKRETIMEQIKSILVTSEDQAIRSVILEIRAGTGGEEAALFAGDLLTMYLKYSEVHGLKTEILDSSPTDLGGFREVILNVKGPGVYTAFGYEGGGHRVQRVPRTETQGRIHTSAATVAVLPEPEEIEVEVAAEDVIEHVSRAGGPGGQNVNKVSSAIRLEHVPTGIVVSMRDERSQHKNRAKAWRVLRLRIYERLEAEKKAQRDQQRSMMIGSGDRSQRIRTYNFPQNRVTDHRIGLDLYSLDRILLGGMDELISALQTYDREQRLKSLEL